MKQTLDTSRDSTLMGQGYVPSWFHEPEPRSFTPKQRFRTIWISDIHLGTAGCNAEILIDFLHSIECETLYLIGDIIDGWRLRKGWFWPASHNEVVRRVLKLARKGTRVIYIPGNHDEMMRDFVGLTFGGVEIAMDAVHETADGRRLMVVHGDMFDGVIIYARWLAYIGDQAYTILLKVNQWLNAIRRRLQLPYWSLSARLKKKVKNAVQFITEYETVVAREAVLRGVDGVVCGHIHSAEIREIGGIIYYNDGDWVESCTALVEDYSGHMRLLDWAEHLRIQARVVNAKAVVA